MDNLCTTLVKLENGEDVYYDGLAIFSIYCTNKRLLANLFIKENSNNRQKLIYELKKISHSTDPELDTTSTVEISAQHQPETIPQNVFSRISSNLDSNASSGNGILQLTKSKLQELYRLRGHLHGQLHNCITDKDRAAIAKEILQTRSKIDKVITEQHLIQQGELPGSEVAKILSVEKYVEIRNVRQYVSRTKKKLDNAQNPANKAKYQNLLEKHQHRLNELLGQDIR